MGSIRKVARRLPVHLRGSTGLAFWGGQGHPCPLWLLQCHVHVLVSCGQCLLQRLLAWATGEVTPLPRKPRDAPLPDLRSALWLASLEQC